MARVYDNAELEFAKAASEMPGFAAAAAKVEARVKANAPVREGDFRASIKTEVVTTPRGVKDRLVYSDDPQAYIIEFGYLSKNGWQKGHFAFSNAYRSF